MVQDNRSSLFVRTVQHTTVTLGSVFDMSELIVHLFKLALSSLFCLPTFCVFVSVSLLVLQHEVLYNFTSTVACLLFFKPLSYWLMHRFGSQEGAYGQIVNTSKCHFVWCLEFCCALPRTDLNDQPAIMPGLAWAALITMGQK